MISRRGQTAEPGEIRNGSEGPHAGLPRTPHTTRRFARWSARRKRDVCVVLVMLLLGVGTIITLSHGSLQVSGQAQVAQPGISPVGETPTSTSGGSPIPGATVTVRTALARNYPFPSSNIGLMQTAVDARGNVWVGEMYANRFARLDTQTGVVTTWIPPDGKNGIMTTVVDAQGNLWFVEQGANYIGRFDPVRQTFRIFPLGTMQSRIMGPQALQFDARGFLWFTAAVGGRIGRLDPATGALQTWPVPPPRPGVLPSPY